MAELPTDAPYTAIVIDVQAAFKNVPVRPDQAFVTGHVWQGQAYVANALPFGAASSPLLYSAFAAALQWLAWKEVVRVVGNPEHVWAAVFVDDHAFAVPSTVAEEARAALLRLFTVLGVPFDASKLQFGTEITYLGLQWNLATRSLHITADKRESLLALLAEVLDTGRLTRKEAKSLVGKLQFNLIACPHGREYLTAVYRAIHLDDVNERVIWLSDTLRDDLTMITDLVRANSGRMSIRRAPQVVLFSDAALQQGEAPTGHAGFYAIGHDKRVRFSHFEIPTWVFAGIEPGRDQGDGWVTSSTLAEAMGVLTALETLTKVEGFLDNKGVLVCCDNIALIFDLKKGRARSTAVNGVIKKILLLVSRHDIALHALHLGRETKHIQLADDLSRGVQEGMHTTFPAGALRFVRPRVPRPF